MLFAVTVGEATAPAVNGIPYGDELPRSDTSISIEPEPHRLGWGVAFRHLLNNHLEGYGIRWVSASPPLPPPP